MSNPIWGRPRTQEFAIKVMRLLVVQLAAAMLVLAPSAATAGNGSIVDPEGDQVVSSGEDLGFTAGDVGKVKIKNTASAITVSLSFHGEATDTSSTETNVVMKWGAGARKRCTFYPSTLVGPDVQCPGEGPAVQGCGASITYGNPQVIKMPRRCMRGAADTLRFKISTNTGILVPNSEPYEARDATKWSGKIGRG